MSNWIQLASGRRFYFADPDREPLQIVDIAHALSHICRFNGHCSRFYSVAEHSVRASWIVPPEFAREALLHDAAEAVLGDVSRPLKALLPDYRYIEAWVEECIRKQYGLPLDQSDEVRDADMTMLATERAQLLPNYREGEMWECLREYPPLTGHDAEGFGWSPERSRGMFLKRYTEVTP